MERWAAILALGLGGCTVQEAAPPVAQDAPATSRPYFVRGMGYVTGLNGRGDSPAAVRAVFAADARLAADIEARNVALVAVTGQIPAGARPGDRFTVQVAAVGDAASLRGGTMVLTPLNASVRLGSAEGAVSVNGPNATSGTIEQGGLLDALPQ